MSILLLASPVSCIFLQKLFVRVVAYFSPQHIILTYNPHIVSTDEIEVCYQISIMGDNFITYHLG